MPHDDTRPYFTLVAQGKARHKNCGEDCRAIFAAKKPLLRAALWTWGLPERPEAAIGVPVSKLVNPGKRSATAGRFLFFCFHEPGSHFPGAVMRPSVKLHRAAAALRRPVDV
jgi:hypothetical protein